MEILGVLLAFVGFALGIYEMINTLRGKERLEEKKTKEYCVA